MEERWERCRDRVPYLTCTLVFSVTMWQNWNTVAKVDSPAKILGQLANSQCRKILEKSSPVVSVMEL